MSATLTALTWLLLTGAATDARCLSQIGRAPACVAVAQQSSGATSTSTTQASTPAADDGDDEGDDEDDAEAAGAPPQRPLPGARPAPRPLGLRAFAFADSTEMMAADTFRATLDTTAMEGIGAGFEVLRIWEGIFARLSYSQSSRTGQRVAVFNGETFPLGISMRVQLNPLEAGAGWRSDFGPGRLVGVYGGGGLLRMRFQQTSDFAQDSENVDETFNGYLAFGGVDVTIGGWVMVGAEAQYRRVPDALGQSGVSAAFDETDLGGTTFRVLVGIRR